MLKTNGCLATRNPIADLIALNRAVAAYTGPYTSCGDCSLKRCSAHARSHGISSELASRSVDAVFSESAAKMYTTVQIGGCDRIVGALANVGYYITDTTVGNILKRHGLDVPPDKPKRTT